MHPPDIPPTASMLQTKSAYRDFFQTHRKSTHLHKLQGLELPIKLAEENPQNSRTLTNYKTKVKKLILLLFKEKIKIVKNKSTGFLPMKPNQVFPYKISFHLKRDSLIKYLFFHTFIYLFLKLDSSFKVLPRHQHTKFQRN